MFNFLDREKFMNKKVVLLSLNYLDMSCVRLVRIVNDEQVLALNIHLNENKNVYAHFLMFTSNRLSFFDKTSKKSTGKNDTFKHILYTSCSLSC